MTAMNQYLAEARMSELRESRLSGRRSVVGNLLSEATQVLKGALLPVSGASASLGQDLRQDMGLR